MKGLCIVFLFALISSEALGMSVRQKRQSNNGQASVDNRYDWDDFRQRPFFPGQMIFPGQNQFPGLNQFPGQLPGQQQQSTTTTAAPVNGAPSAAAIQQCIRQCPVTTEYNPVCGTNNVTYDNPGRLTCAKDCGVDVTQQRSSRCPAVTPAPS